MYNEEEEEEEEEEDEDEDEDEELRKKATKKAPLIGRYSSTLSAGLNSRLLAFLVLLLLWWKRSVECLAQTVFAGSVCST